MKKVLVFAPIGDFITKVIHQERGKVNHLRTEVGMGDPLIKNLKKG